MLDPYLLTPHAMDFRCLAEQFSLPYFQAGTADGLAAAYAAALRAGRSVLLEVTLSAAEDLRVFRAMQQVRLDG
jgi:2-succinyl-5-enolpyruvyl-6-hydroxy-3-cyclohexene-1-carboxylate synthase